VDAVAVTALCSLWLLEHCGHCGCYSTVDAVAITALWTLWLLQHWYVLS